MVRVPARARLAGLSFWPDRDSQFMSFDELAELTTICFLPFVGSRHSPTDHISQLQQIVAVRCFHLYSLDCFLVGIDLGLQVRLKLFPKYPISTAVYRDGRLL